MRATLPFSSRVGKGVTAAKAAHSATSTDRDAMPKGETVAGKCLASYNNMLEGQTERMTACALFASRGSFGVFPLARRGVEASEREQYVNAYEQLVAIKGQLELNGAHEDSIALVEKFIARAESERDSATAVPQIMMVRHLLRQREALDSHPIYDDLQELMSGYEARRGVRNEEQERYAYEEERKPRPKSYYQSLKADKKQPK